MPNLFNHLHHVCIVVSDLERSKAFYRALGFIDGDERVMADKTLSFMRLGAIEIELFAYNEPVASAELPERMLGFNAVPTSGVAVGTAREERALAHPTGHARRRTQATQLSKPCRIFSSGRSRPMKMMRLNRSSPSFHGRW